MADNPLKKHSDVINHYDLLITEGNDPVLDPPALQEYMNKWDGQLFIDLLNLKKEESVLEIGCGTGRLAIKTAPMSKFFCGIDISPKTTEMAKEHLPFDNTAIVCGDFLTYEFETHFDVIYSSLTFMHIREKRTAIEKVENLLAANGRFVLSIDKNQSSSIVYGVHLLEVYPDTPEEITTLLKKSGLGKIEIFETEFAYIIVAMKE